VLQFSTTINEPGLTSEESRPIPAPLKRLFEDGAARKLNSAQAGQLAIDQKLQGGAERSPCIDRQGTGQADAQQAQEDRLLIALSEKSAQITALKTTFCEDFFSDRPQLLLREGLCFPYRALTRTALGP
jgi:hypothetical protein